jgi:hypothetical protein
VRQERATISIVDTALLDYRQDSLDRVWRRIRTLEIRCVGLELLQKHSHGALLLGGHCLQNVSHIALRSYVNREGLDLTASEVEMTNFDHSGAHTQEQDAVLFVLSTELGDYHIRRRFACAI